MIEQQKKKIKYVKLNYFFKTIRTIVLKIGSNLKTKLYVQTSIQLNKSLISLLCMKIVLLIKQISSAKQTCNKFVM